MSYFDWRGNRQGKSIYDTNIPVAMCLYAPLIVLLFLIIFSSCAFNQLDQLAGRHTIKHPETGKKIWISDTMGPENWDGKNKVWRYDNGEICGDGYLYD